MRKLKALIGSWDRRALIFQAAGAAIGFITMALVRFLAPTSVREIGAISIAIILVMLLLMKLRPLVKRTLPIPRVKHTVEMSLIEIINEFTYTGYRVEAMTENTVILVRFSMKHLILGVLLLTGLFWIPFAPLASTGDVTEELATAAVLIPLFSFIVVYMYTITGYGYDRITFNQREQDGPSTCVTSINAFLPSRVDLAIVSTEDHGDEEWYRAHPDRL